MMHSFSTVSSKVDEGIRLQSVHAKDIVAEVVTRIVRELEDRAIGAVTVTTDGLKSALMDCLRASATVVLGNQQARQDGGADAEEANLNEQPAGNHHQQEAVEDRGRSLFFWDGKFHLFPQGFELPTGSVSQVWQLWCCGDPDQRVPPLKSLQPTDLETRNARKRLSDLKFLMSIIENRAVEMGKMKPRLNIMEAIEIFETYRLNIHR
ncbi:hypothetical protein PsorP6_002974 [Peronosclerospora sorghi]|uniref:Uncharacterized protein n=1 Tax=Peronosclerospora sorghi TaxID=230839 RepID=A0ACC0VIU8_9STRA|nr:hypothetical protein PsorP6_002974 [Peronosclerospora sorghi]